MKKYTVFLCSLIMAFSLVGVAGAVPVTFTDLTQFTANGPAEDLNGFGGEYANKLEGAGDYVWWTHHFEFNPPMDSIISATLELTFRDDNRDSIWQPFEFGGYLGEDGSWFWQEIGTGSIGPFSLNVNHLRDGSFSAIVLSTGGDFFIDQSALTISYNSAAPVPEPSTMVLLGIGLLGLAGASRKKFKKN